MVSVVSGVVYEFCWYMRGLERWLMDLITQPDFCQAMLDQTTNFWLDWFRLFLDEVGDLVDVIMLGDDLAGENGPLFRPEIYRALVKPRQKQLVQYIRSRTRAKTWYHTCGSCLTYIPDLVDIGIDVLNPVQISAKGMDPATLKTQFGDRMNFWGGAHRRPARFAHGLAGNRAGARSPQSGSLEARRRLRVQQRAQHPGWRAARKHRGDVRRRLRIRILRVRIMRIAASSQPEIAATSPPGGNRGYLVAICLVAALGGFLFGFETAVVNGTIERLEAQYAFSDLMKGLVVSSALAGCLFGAAIAGTLSDRFGRKSILLLSAVLFAVSAIGCAFPVGPHAVQYLILARFFSGCGIGIAFDAFAALHCGDRSGTLRGGLISMYQCAITVGALAAFLSNYCLWLLSQHALGLDWGHSGNGSS